MHQQEERNPIQLIERWRTNPPGIREITEGELISLLREIEQQRSTNPDGAALDRAEAVVLTRMAAQRMTKRGGVTLAEEWLERAEQLDPTYLTATEYRLQLCFSQLRDHVLANAFPSIRETDNVVTRRRTVEVLSALAASETDDMGKWRTLAAKAVSLATKLKDPQCQAIAAQVEQIYVAREQLLLELKERVQAYAGSLSGVFFSTEMLGQLQDTIRKLAAQHEQKALLLQQDESGEEEEDAGRELSALEQLEGLIGLGEIKLRVRQLAQFLQYQRLREEKGWHMHDQLPLHLVLMGNPGTGKTTLARLMARLYHELGLLEHGQMIEVDRSHLIGAYVGQTEQRVMEAVKQADGGVLFIDEAYSLKRPDSSGSDYGQVAIDTLVAAMTSGEYAGRFVVILAGYPEEMRHFLLANPGLYSRFPETGHFLLPNYSAEELLLIADHVAHRNDFSLTAPAKLALRQRVEKSQVDDTFGNARTVTNIVLDAIFSKGRATAGKDLQWEDYTVLLPEDVAEDVVTTDEPTATERLESLVGLEQVKAELKKIAAFVAVQQERGSLGMPMSPVELHAVFTGNPGTGKTTVAALYAQILKEIGYLKRGHLVQASRADLVAGYVGQTAAHTRRKVREALGGVLFIDEAYSLLGNGERDFGQEAIHTLVEEMTRHEENLVVVLAGYPFEMNQLLTSNPGLLSRFKKYVHFADYTVDELVLILQQAASEAGYQIDSRVIGQIKDKLLAVTESQRLDGNGRFSRNLLQEAMQHQAVRLMAVPKQSWTQELLTTLEWADFAPMLDWIGEEKGTEN
ncbi:AAA family ATPase [Brevibacillus choshinensis]|uniref:AAA family ATPase n=1 Tax=Brevibacillus choshinensis TaxID=54911 RepID=A0ABX7FXW7_BRECH|nr:AAA family ATPase [Brevibacillus choshinensis]